MWQDRDSLCHPALRQGRDAHKNGGRIGRIVTPCRTPVPPLPAHAGGRYYLNVSKYADLLNMTEQVRKVTNAHECKT